ncbi:SH3 domain-containing protein [Mariprofundus erugo]|nr:SH3 domain-containing protein [Mariprofundus erugo]
MTKERDMKSIRQWVWAMLMMAMAVVGGLPFAADQAEAGDMAVLSLTRSAKLHVAPSSPSRVIEMVAKGERCQQLDTQDKWVQVSMDRNGHTGWIHRSYLRPVAAAEPPVVSLDDDIDSVVTIEAAPTATRRAPVVKKSRHHVVAAKGPLLKLSKSAKLHADASGSSRVLKIVGRGETGVWLDKVDVWVKLRMDRGGRTGWIHQSYLVPAKKAPASEH